ncbi:MAG: hypothetical protein JNM74_13550 [Myxococcales bacterium]|nr:hypothetical protein [Myxococcales bacterium]
MPRIDAPEIEDFDWFPSRLRDPMTGFLRVASEVVGMPDVAAPIVASAMRAGATSNIVDLCAGGGGPVLGLARRLVRGGLAPRVTLTDLYPNDAAFSQAEAEAPGIVRGERAPVSATEVPEALSGVRTIFNALHHLPPAVAEAVFTDAAEKRQPLCVFELVERSLQGAVIAAGVPLAVLGLMPFVKPRRLEALALTYALPVLPALIGWDGFASCLRSYSVQELRELTARAARPGYTFTVGRTRAPYRPAWVTWVVGKPE